MLYLGVGRRINPRQLTIAVHGFDRVPGWCDKVDEAVEITAAAVVAQQCAIRLRPVAFMAL